MKTRLIYFVICLTLVNCKNSKPELIFKYSDKPIAINCSETDSKLFNEALHHFEESITEKYQNKNSNLNLSYRTFIRESATNRIDYNTISDQHSLDVFEALKNIDGLWIQNKDNISINYNHEIFKCISNNIIDKDIKTTYNALLSTKSMNFRMLKDLLITKSNRLNTDKYLATHVALELYYSKLSNVDLSKQQETPKDTKTLKEKDPHAGHDHD